MKFILFIFFLIFINCKTSVISETHQKIKCSGEEFYIESICDDERNLLQWAEKYKSFTNLNSLDNKALFRIMREEGIDKASAVFYHRAVLETKFLFEYLKEKQSNHEAENIKTQKVLLLVLPGMFYQDHDSVDSTAKGIRNIALKLGIDSNVLNTQQTGTIYENASILCNFLKRPNEYSKLIIVSASKGSTDFLESINMCKENMQKIIGWINIGGINKGTLIVDELSNNYLANFKAKLYFLMNAYNWNGLLSIKYNPEYFNSIVIPKKIKVINIIGVPTNTMISSRARPYYNLLSKYGPNEGMNLLGDTIIKNSINFPLWRNDHYFRVPIPAEKISKFLKYIIKNSNKEL
ncbi:MAG: hypothetical protein H7A25_11365 [Leptospiraceae bacterium]|nr:hypothetical protein [Leptospiraceae bacterium]